MIKVIKSKSIIVESRKANKYFTLDNSHGNGANKNLKTKNGDKNTNSEKLVGMMFSWNAIVGTFVGVILGKLVGLLVGVTLGNFVGDLVGIVDGDLLGSNVGIVVGCNEGIFDGIVEE